MASAGRKSKFLNPGSCSIAGCEVTLLLDGQTRLYACKHVLIDKCGFFKGLFTADFKEKNSSEVKVQEVSHSNMLLFLEYVCGNNKALPSDSDSLCSLISLADQFMCTSLQENLIDHLGTESMFLNLSLDTKLALIRAADKYKKGCLQILDTCVRLCANLKLTDMPVLSAHISSGTMLAVYETVAQTAKCIERLTKAEAPTHQCERVRYGRRGGERIVYETRQFHPQSSMVEVNGKQVDAWECNICDEKEIKETFNYGHVKAFEIDQNKLKE